ncbi:MAG: Ig-like domain-containing protein, partial [Solirubrobacteraceae bacterium]
STPTLTGTAGELAGDGAGVVVTVYEGSSIGGAVVQSAAVAREGSSWKDTLGQLADGTYTAQAVQGDEAGNVGESEPVTFTVDTTKPVVTIAQPAALTNDPTPELKGEAGTLPGDGESVQLKIYKGASATGSPSQIESVSVTSGEWAHVVAHLSDGEYTAQVEQEDEAGNVGKSGEVTFTVDATPPVVTIAQPPAATNDATPELKGAAGALPGDATSVQLKIYKGATATGAPSQSKSVSVSGTGWAQTAAHLSDGQYTAQVEQKDAAGNVGKSGEVTFTVDTVEPVVTISQPAALTNDPTPELKGEAGTLPGDETTLQLKIYKGASATGSPRSESVNVTSGKWSQAVAALSDGEYTAQVEQKDEAGNVGKSGEVTFTVDATPPTPTPTPQPSPQPAPVSPVPPVASFQSFPTVPHVGVPVSLVSTSSAISSPIVAFAWALLPGGALKPGQQVLTTTFTKAGPHVVRLRVTDANGLASEVSETIQVAPTELVLMQPFPVVRIAGSARASSVRISLFTVLAPVGAKVTVVCKGHGCPSRPLSFTVTPKGKGKTGTVLVSLSRFERVLKAGAVLEVRISKPGEIGKYTRFTVRHGKLPSRVDDCLGTKPMSCPSA